MKRIISKVLQLDCFSIAPPILVDIGASGNLPEKWRYLAPFSICVAFDADTRDFQITESVNSGWRKLYSLNRLVAPMSSTGVDFYLTRSPHCSSALPPNNEALKPWAFNSLFDLEKKVQLPSVDLNSALKEIGIDRVDWYKSDTQGTDLRIFSALPSEIIEQIIVADFEPGIIDAYFGEDKLCRLMEYMDKRPFWVSDMVIKGSQRINTKVFQRLNYLQKRSPATFFKTSPGWCEITYINTCELPNLTLRDCLLAWVFASINGQHAFAIHLAMHGEEQFKHEIFPELLAVSRNRLLMGYPRIVLKVLKRIFCLRMK